MWYNNDNAELNRNMKKFFTHWTFAFVTLFALTWIGLQDPQVKEILRLKSFDLLLQSETKEISKDIAVIAIDDCSNTAPAPAAPSSPAREKVESKKVDSRGACASAGPPAPARGRDRLLAMTWDTVADYLPVETADAALDARLARVALQTLRRVAAIGGAPTGDAAEGAPNRECAS